MKKVFIILCFFFWGSISHAQSSYQYLLKRGAAKMAMFAHPSNTFNAGNSTVTQYDDYFMLDLFYTDNTDNGYPIHTTIKLGRCVGNFYFGNLNAISDNDEVSPFLGLLVIIKVMLEAARQNNPRQYDEELSNMRNYLGIEPDNWNGAQWALFLINLDYGCNCVAD